MTVKIKNPEKNFSNNHYVWLSIFSILYLVEFFLFKKYILLEIIPFYPSAFDQTNYLKVAYTAYEKILTDGFFKGLSNTSTPNSILFIPQATLFFLVFGATRFSALLLNFFYFIFLQTSIIYLIRWISGKYIMAAVFLGILLSISVSFHIAGGLIDFRIDFITLCLYGIFAASIVRSNVFLEKKWSIIAAFIATVMVLTRCLTSTYLLLSIGLIFAYSSISLLNSTNNYVNKTRLKNIILFSIILCTFTLPILWFHRDFLYNYYITLGAIKEISFRNLETNTTDLSHIILYYPTSILFEHLGVKTLYLLGLLYLISISFFLYNKYILGLSKTSDSSLSVPSLFMINFFLISSFMIPIIILSIYPTKSPSVGSITVIPIILFFIINSIALLQNSQSSHILLFFLAAIFLMMGLQLWSHHTQNHRSPLFRTEAIRLNKMYEDIGNYIELTQWKNASFSTDQVSDYLSALILTDLYYEKNKKILPVNSTLLGGSVFSITESKAKELLLNSEIYITNHKNYPPSVYPFNTSMDSIRHSLNELAKKHFIPLGTYSYKENQYYHIDHDFQVYVKPDFNISGIFEGYINPNGLLLTIPWQVTNHASQITISGDAALKTLRHYKLSAFLSNGELNIPLSANLDINNNHYTISIKLPKKQMLARTNSVVKITFPKKTPEELLINNKKTVLYAPRSKEVIISQNI